MSIRYKLFGVPANLDEAADLLKKKKLEKVTITLDTILSERSVEFTVWLDIGNKREFNIYDHCVTSAQEIPAPGLVPSAEKYKQLAELATEEAKNVLTEKGFQVNLVYKTHK